MGAFYKWLLIIPGILACFTGWVKDSEPEQKTHLVVLKIRNVNNETRYVRLAKINNNFYSNKLNWNKNQLKKLNFPWYLSRIFQNILEFRFSKSKNSESYYVIM